MLRNVGLLLLVTRNMPEMNDIVFAEMTKVDPIQDVIDCLANYEL